MNILLTGNSFHGYDSDNGDALTALGHNVDLLFNNIHGPFNKRWDFPKKLAYGILPNKLNVHRFVDKSVTAYNEAVREHLQRKRYDLILFIGAKTVTEETLQQINVPKALWFMDGIQYYNNVRPKLALFDHVFFFEPTDTRNESAGLNGQCSTLHLGFNPKRFFPTQAERRYDFSFVGSYYPNRDELLHAVITDTTNAIIIGDFHRSQYDNVKRLNKQRQIPIEEVNELYNASVININVHHKQSIEGLNVRTFEVQGSGNLQLVENQLAAQVFFTDEHDILLYDSPEMFRDKLAFYLKHPEFQQKIRENAYANALANHTWKHRMITLLDELKTRSIL